MSDVARLTLSHSFARDVDLGPDARAAFSHQKPLLKLTFER